MSDYSWVSIHKDPPRPKPGFFLWLLSFVRPLSGWTVGASNKGPARQEWVLRRGKSKPYRFAGNCPSLIHSCPDGSDCQCCTGRQF